MANPRERRCRAFAASSAQQCKHERVFGSRYCWHHQSWGATLITLLIGALSGFVINVISNKYTERAPKLVPFLNWEPLALDTVFVYPTNATYPSNAPSSDFTFWVRNNGDMDATEMFLRLTTHSYASNFVDAPKWLVEEVGSFRHTDQMLATMVQRADRPIPPGFAAKFQPFSLDSSKVNVFGGFLVYGALGAETKRARVHIFFENPPGVTNVLRGKSARDYIRKCDPGVADRADTVTIKLIFESTNEASIFQSGSPGARIEVISFKPNASATFKTNTGQ